MLFSLIFLDMILIFSWKILEKRKGDIKGILNNREKYISF